MKIVRKIEISQALLDQLIAAKTALTRSRARQKLVATEALDRVIWTAMTALQDEAAAKGTASPDGGN